MTLKKALLWGSLSWITGITLLHAWLNLDLFRREKFSGQSFKVGYLPVT